MRRRMIKSVFALPMSAHLSVAPKFRPALDPEFLPASLWNRAYRALAHSGGASPLAMALERSDGGVSVFRTAILPHEGAHLAVNQRYTERLLKYLLWQKGGWRITIAGEPRIAESLRAVYSPEGARAFAYRFMGERVYGRPMTIESVPYDACPGERESAAPLGRHLDGCRIGFDLGASDRKCAAVIDGQVVFSDEVPWNPAVQSDPQYHYDGVHDSLNRAAAHLPRVDAIGGPPPRRPPGQIRHAHPPPLLRPASRLARRSLRRGQRWRSHRARRLHGARLYFAKRQRRAWRRLRQLSRRRVRHPPGQHHLLAQRARLRPRRLPRGCPHRRMVRRPRRRRAVLLPTGRRPPARSPRHRSSQGNAAPRQARTRAATHGRRRPPRPQNLPDHRRLLRLQHRHLCRFLRGAQPPRPGPRAHRRGRRSDPLYRHRSPPGRVPRSRRAHPVSHPRREGEAARPSHRRRQPSVHFYPGDPLMQFHKYTTDFFVPDGIAPDAALARTTHLCISAHQDDIEIMAYHGVAECFGRKDKWFTGVVVTKGAGSPRAGIYGDFSDQQMQQVRVLEQRKAAYVGEYACQIQLAF